MRVVLVVMFSYKHKLAVQHNFGLTCNTAVGSDNLTNNYIQDSSVPSFFHITEILIS